MFWQGTESDCFHTFFRFLMTKNHGKFGNSATLVVTDFRNTLDSESWEALCNVFGKNKIMN